MLSQPKIYILHKASFLLLASAGDAAAELCYVLRQSARCSAAAARLPPTAALELATQHRTGARLGT